MSSDGGATLESLEKFEPTTTSFAEFLCGRLGCIHHLHQWPHKRTEKEGHVRQSLEKRAKVEVEEKKTAAGWYRTELVEAPSSCWVPPASQVPIKPHPEPTFSNAQHCPWPTQIEGDWGTQTSHGDGFTSGVPTPAPNPSMHCLLACRLLSLWSAVRTRSQIGASLACRLHESYFISLGVFNLPDTGVG